VPWRSAPLDLAHRLRGVCSRCCLPPRASAPSPWRRSLRRT